MVLITLADGFVLDSTDGHPIWDATRRAFVDASQLHAGDMVETSTNEMIGITALADYTADLTAYNLQIDEMHTYHAGSTPVPVHNSCGPLTASQVTQMAERVGYRATNQTLRGQRVFTNGKNYILKDIDSHAGGLWKMADTIRGLGSKTTRTGTYDYDLNYGP